MYCKNCGKEISKHADVCVHCGISTSKGEGYCTNCGSETPKGADFCVKCGKATQKTSEQREGKSKIAAGLLALFVGYLGVHDFYLGYTGRGIAKLCLTFGWSLVLFIFPIFGILAAVPSAFACGIWTIIDAIMIFTGHRTDVSGNPLRD